MQVFFSMEGKALLARIKGELDLDSADRLRQELEASLEHAKPDILVLDMEGVTFIDSSGLGVIMGRYRCLKKQGRKIIITKPQPQVMRLLQLSGLNKIMTISNETIESYPGVLNNNG